MLLSFFRPARNPAMKNPVLKTAYAVTVLAGVVYAFVSLEGPNGIPALMARRRLVAEYERQNQQIMRENNQKEQRIDRLENNPLEQEMVIRQQLKLAKPGEKIYIYDETNNPGKK
jgi:cell division protein FtsB